MSLDFIKDYIGEIFMLIPTVLAFFFGRSKGQAELKQVQGDALHTMQTAYDAFTLDTMKKFDEMKAEIEDIHKGRNIILKENKELQAYIKVIEKKLDDCINLVNK